MKLRMALFALFFALTVSAASAQTNAPANKPAAEIPPDVKAFQDANKIADATEKIAALEKFKKDFPASEIVSSANISILSVMTSKMSSQTAHIHDFAKTIVAGAKDKKEKASLSAEVADTLLTNKVLLKDAEKYAKASLDSMNQNQFLAEQKAQFSKRTAAAKGTDDKEKEEDKPKPPTDQELIKRFRQSRASRLATLGRIEFELGNTPAALKSLTEAHAADHDQPGAQATLGEIAVKNGDNAAALEYLIPARLGGQSAPSTVAALSTAYSNTHNGSTAGLDQMLDAEYRKRFPEPLHLDAYKPSAKRSERLVLAEVFTGSGCPPCVGADLAFDAAMERYSRKDLAVVMYHQHVPRPDPMTNSDNQARLKYYDVHGVPTYFIDGSRVEYNGAGRNETKTVWEHIQQPIEKELDAPPEAKITVNAAANGDSVKVNASVVVTTQSKDLVMHVLLIEKELTYSGENGVRFHPMAVRAMGGKDGGGFALDPAVLSPVEQTWDLEKLSASLKTQLDNYEAKGHRGNSFKFIEKKYQIDRANLAVVVFVQDSKNKHILQAAYVDLAPAPHVTTGNAGEAR